MTEDVAAYAVLFGWCGFVWGQWWAERKARKSDDVGLRLLADMAMKISDKRKARWR